MTVFTKDLNGSNIMMYGGEVSPYSKSTIASNVDLANPLTGEYIGLKNNLSEEEQVGLIGEYDFFILYAENLIQLYSKVLQADSLGKLDRL